MKKNIILSALLLTLSACSNVNNDDIKKELEEAKLKLAQQEELISKSEISLGSIRGLWDVGNDIYKIQPNGEISFVQFEPMPWTKTNERCQYKYTGKATIFAASREDAAKRQGKRYVPTHILHVALEYKVATTEYKTVCNDQVWPKSTKEVPLHIYNGEIHSVDTELPFVKSEKWNYFR